MRPLRRARLKRDPLDVEGQHRQRDAEADHHDKEASEQNKQMLSHLGL